MLKNIFYIDVILYSIIIIYISFDRKIYINKPIINILFLLLIILICVYNKTLGILASILYINSLTNNRKDQFPLYESFSTVDKNGLHDLNNVLKFLKTPKSKKVLETMFVDKSKLKD